jgi:MFS family permease
MTVVYDWWCMKRSWTRVLIYLFPGCMDLVLSLVLFVNSVRAARLYEDPRVVTGLTTMFGLVYMLSCPIVGRWLNARNASAMILSSCCGVVLLSAVSYFVTSIIGMYLIVTGTSVCSALFFAPFMVFMKEVDSGGRRPLSYSTGMYTFSWSMGFAMGPLISGFLIDIGTGGWKLCYLVSGLVGAGTFAGILALRHMAHTGHENGERDVAETGAEALPDLAWLGWISAIGCFVALAVVRSLFPAEAEHVHGFSGRIQGVIIFAISFAQGITALLLCRSRLWMFRPLPVAMFGVFGLAGLLLIAGGSSPLMLTLGATLLGVFSGGFCFYFVYHALAHPIKASRYAAVNETVVGICNIVGPLFAGVTARWLSYGYAYTYTAVLVAAVLLFQIVVHARTPVQKA